MTSLNPKVLVVGLGTAGAAACAFLARSGLAVTGVDRAALTHTGARWVNGVPAWVFDTVGLERPSAPELRAAGVPFHLVAGWTGPEVALTSALEVDMRHLTERLLHTATANGARLHGETRVVAIDDRVAQTSAGALDFDVVVDATGHAGLSLLGAPAIDRTELCTAAQYVHRLADRQAAHRWLEERRAAPGEVVCATGVAGGYSIVNVRVEGDEVAILTGSIPALGHPSGHQLLEAFRAANPWVGESLFGGSRSIPLRRPLEVVGWGRVVAIGDSASMVFSAHGSGILQQLLAARMLADRLVRGDDPWAFNVAWQRAHGGLLASTDLIRRATSQLDEGQIRRMVERGVLSSEMSADAMLQQSNRPSPRAVLRAARGMAKLPAVVRTMLPALAKGPLVEQHYRAYPTSPSQLPTWLHRLERLTGLPTWSPL